MTDGTFEGFLAGVAGSWSGLFTSIYVKDDRSAGFLTGSLTGTAENGSLVAGGHVVRSPVLGTAAIDPQDLMSVMSNPGTEANLYLKGTGSVPGAYVPILGEVDIRGNRSSLWGTAGAPEKIGGISLSSPYGSILGVWANTYAGDSYANDEALLTWPMKWGFGGHGRYETYMMGDIVFTDDLQGHARISGEVDYLDERFTGKINLTYQGTYSSNDNSEGVSLLSDRGRRNHHPRSPPVQPCASGGLLRNLDGQPETAGDYRGIMGSTAGPFLAPASFVTMGQYREDLASGAYLFTSSLTGGELARRVFAGICGGIHGRALEQGQIQRRPLGQPERGWLSVGRLCKARRRGRPPERHYFGESPFLLFQRRDVDRPGRTRAQADGDGPGWIDQHHDLPQCDGRHSLPAITTTVPATVTAPFRAPSRPVRARSDGEQYSPRLGGVQNDLG